MDEIYRKLDTLQASTSLLADTYNSDVQITESGHALFGNQVRTPIINGLGATLTTKVNNITIAVANSSQIDFQGKDLVNIGNVQSTTSTTTETINVNSNLLIVNAGQTGVPVSTLISGIEIERGSSTNYQFVFRESDDTFCIGEKTNDPLNLQAVLTREADPYINGDAGGVFYYNGSAFRADTDGVFHYNPTTQVLKAHIIGSTDGYKISGDVVLSGTTLGSTIVSSSLTSIGTQAAGVNIATGQTYKVNAVDVLSGTTLGTNVVSSSLTSVGVLSGLAVGGAADALALATFSSTTKGLLIPRMTTTQKNAITGTIPTGLLVYDTTLLALNHYNGSAWASISGSASNPVVVAINNTNSPYSLTTATDILVCTASSGAITITLPTAVGNSGKIFRLIRTDTTLANAITINTTSSQTIGVGKSTRYMWTANESWQIVSDGANWQIISHLAQTGYTTTATLTITAVTTSPSKGTATIQRDENVWRRDGADLLCTAIFAKSANGTATIGSGDYLFALPLSLTHTLPVYTGTIDQFKNYPMGTSYSVANGSKIVGGIALPYSTTTYRMSGFSATDSNSISSIYNQITASADLVYSATYRCPITNWDE
jgi:hypothetical protein